MALLSRNQILESRDLNTLEVAVPEWPAADGTPGTVRFRQLSAEEAMRLTQEMQSDQSQDGMFILMVRTMCDDNLDPIFTMEDLPALRKKSMRVLMRLQDEALRVNHMLTNGEEGGDLKKP